VEDTCSRTHALFHLGAYINGHDFSAMTDEPAGIDTRATAGVEYPFALDVRQ
jgi:hypothetical protein